jgi:hypothetical protein
MVCFGRAGVSLPRLRRVGGGPGGLFVSIASDSYWPEGGL